MMTDEELSIMDWLFTEKERAQKQLKETQRIGGHSCYGAGVECGIIETCQRLEDFINENNKPPFIFKIKK